MRLTRLQLNDFRNYVHLDFQPAPGLNLVVGANGQGKTNLLEAVWVLTGARSPRVAEAPQLVRHGAAVAHVQARLLVDSSGATRELSLSIGRSAPHRTFVVNGKRTTRAVQALGSLLAVWMSPDAVDTVRGAPELRRHFLDVTLAQVDPIFRGAAVRFARILAQRNRALRQVAAGEVPASALEVWDEQLVRAAGVVSLRRRALLARLGPVARAVYAHVAGETEGPLALEYRPSPGALPAPASDAAADPKAYEQALARRLAELRAAEIARGVTLSGPHREDFQVLLGEIDLRRAGSRGQQRSAAIALTLATWEVVRQASGEGAILLLDDVASELDEGRRRRLLEALPPGAQAILTATEPELLLGAGGRERVAATWRVSAGRLEVVPG